MEAIHLSVLINADVQKVWHTMLDDKTYRQWTKSFHEGSYYEGSWEQGKELHFIAPDENGKLQGMASVVKENTPYKFISLEHFGLISDGAVDTLSEEVKKWAPSFENYTFTAKGDKTELKIDMEIELQYKKMFLELWRKALTGLKELCEKS